MTTPPREESETPLAKLTAAIERWKADLSREFPNSPRTVAIMANYYGREEVGLEDEDRDCIRPMAELEARLAAAERDNAALRADAERHIALLRQCHVLTRIAGEARLEKLLDAAIDAASRQGKPNAD